MLDRDLIFIPIFFGLLFADTFSNVAAVLDFQFSTKEKGAAWRPFFSGFCLG